MYVCSYVTRIRQMPKIEKCIMRRAGELAESMMEEEKKVQQQQQRAFHVRAAAARVQRRRAAFT